MSSFLPHVQLAQGLPGMMRSHSPANLSVIALTFCSSAIKESSLICAALSSLRLAHGFASAGAAYFFLFLRDVPPCLKAGLRAMTARLPWSKAGLENCTSVKPCIFSIDWTLSWWPSADEMMAWMVPLSISALNAYRQKFSLSVRD